MSPIQEILQLGTQVCACQGQAAHAGPHQYTFSCLQQHASMQHTPGGTLLVYSMTIQRIYENIALQSSGQLPTYDHKFQYWLRICASCCSTKNASILGVLLWMRSIVQGNGVKWNLHMTQHKGH